MKYYRYVNMAWISMLVPKFAHILFVIQTFDIEARGIL